MDELCPEGVYIAAERASHPPQLVPDLQTQNIPLLDGQENVDREWWCYCCMYAKLFETEERLHLVTNQTFYFYCIRVWETIGLISA